jgi:hypothetical protein
MTRTADTREMPRKRWPRLAALAAIAVLAGGLVSCDGGQVVQPPDNGVVWTRLTPTGLNACRYPDLFGDSLVYTAFGTNPGVPGVFWDRLVFSGDDGEDPFLDIYPGLAQWIDFRPRWAGRQIIVFQSNRGGNFDIWYRDVVTLADRKLFASSLHESAPAPRPNSPGLAYVEFANPATPTSTDLSGRIVLIPDTAAVPIEKIYLTPDTLQVGEPDWDPTGQRLVFSVLDKVDFTRHLYTMSLAPGDSLPIQITTGASHDFSPRWSPDGNRILFASDRTGRSGLWVVHPEGEAQGLKLAAFDDRNAGVITPIWTLDGMGIIASSNGRGGVRSLWLLTNLPAFGF